MNAAAQRPITLLVAALGGEGGGVLSNWLVWAAGAEGYVVQSTSIPGVAQRTGATTYYIELFPTPIAELDGREPVFALTPSPGNLDVMVASELVEAGRAMQNGFVSPDRTTLIASTHRIYSIVEKSAMADGRYDGTRVLGAAEKMARDRILFDMRAAAREAGSVISAVLLGAIAGSGRLPIPQQTFEAAIRESGIAVEANLAGFAAGFGAAMEGGQTPPGEEPDSGVTPVLPGAARERIESTHPEEVRDIVEAGATRMVDYQDEIYLSLYLEQLDSVLSLDREGGGEARGFALTRECARHLALWMAYEDVIRVADLKTRATRFARIRSEVGARAGEPVIVTDFLKPGLEEITSLMPRWLARLVRWIGRTLGLEERLNIGLKVRSTAISGFLVLWSLAKLKRWRRRTARYGEEQAHIARWLGAVDRAARLDYDLALEVVECARLVKGYGETHRRGLGNFLRIMEAVVAPMLDAGAIGDGAARIARARSAALADPEGDALEKALVALSEMPSGEEAPVPLMAAGD